ncbi:uncharacterized protein LOC100199397 isoform X6 [Hydra vulgaris]|uniref:Uncharacterized protein LOC100199397 isoform X6 n=1 Tax=Hydra vulgaris TaxID=6087 RepID=A0ABM4BCZ5_HYDVU
MKSYYLYCMCFIRHIFIMPAYAIVGSALMLSDSISSDSSLVSQINSHVINSTLLFSMTPFVTKVISIEDSPRSTSFLVSETTLNFLSTITGLFGNSVTSFFSTSRLIIEPTLSQESTVQHSTEIRSKLVNTTFFGNELFSTPTPFIMTSRISESLILLSLPDSSSIMYSSLLVEKTTYLKSLSAYLHSSILSKSEVNQSDKTTHQTLFLTKELKTDNFFDSVSRTTNPINLFTNSDTAFASKFNFSTKSLLEGTATTNSISSTFIQSSSVIKMFSDISILNMTNRVGIESSILDSVSTINMNKSMFSYIYATKSFSNSIVNKSISYSVNSSITDMIQSSILDVLDNSKIYKTPTLIFPSKTNIFNSVSILSNSLEFNSNKVFTSFGSKSNIPDSISVSTKSTSSLTLSQLFTTQAAESLLNSIPVKSVFYSLSSDFSKIVRSSTWNVLNSTLIERTPAMFSSKFSIFNSDHIFSHSLGFSSPYTVNINHNVTITTSQNIPSVTNVTVVQMNSSLLPSYINTYAILTSNFNNSYFSTVLETSFVASESFIGTKQSSISNFSAMITPSFSLVCTAIIMSSYVPCWTTSDVTQTDTNSVYDQSNFSTVSQDLKSLIQPTESFPSTADTTNVESSNLKSEFIITSSKDVLLPNQSFTATLSMCLIYYSTLVLNSLDISLTSDVSNKFTDTVLVSTPNTVWFNTNGYSLQVTSSILDDISSKKMTNEISYTATSVLNIVPSFSALEFSSLNTVFVFSDNLVTSQSIQSIFNQTTMQLSTLPNTLITSTPNTLASVDIFSSVIGSSVELASLISGSSYPGIDSTATSTDFVSFIEPTNVTLIPSIMSATFLETIVCMSYTVIESSFSSFIISTIVNTSTTSRSFTTLVTDLSIQTTQSFSIYSSALPITTTKPETTLIPVDIVVRISLSINESVDVTSNEFRKDLERKLVETFISLKSANKRKRRSVSINNITAMIEKTQRIGQQVIVEFTIAEDNAYLKASDIASVYNYLSESGLSRKLGYKVNGPVSVSLPTTMPYQLSDVVGIVVVESASNNLSLPLNQFYFENNLTEYYNQYYNDSLIKVKTIFSKIEVSQQIYLELVFIVNGVSQNASSIVSFFNNKNLTELSMGLSIQVLEKPFVVNAIRAVKQTDIIKIVIKTPNSLNISNPAYMYDLSLKLSLIYMKGQQRNRLRRATGSVVADIRSIYDLYNGNHQAIFVIIDQGVIKTASEAVAIMNKISVSDMSALLEMQVISPPETFLSTIVKSSYVVKYWIIAVVIVPIIFITFLCIGIIWKYKSKLAPRKIQPRKIEPEKIMESTHGSNLVSPVINKKNVLNEKQSISVPLFSASNEMQNESEHNKSLRRKVKKKPVTVKKQNQTSKKEHVNNEDQEDGCEDNGDDSDDNDNEEEDDEDENKQLPIVSIRKKVSTPVGKQNSKYTHLENEKSMFPLSPIYQRPKTLSASIDKSSEVKANAVTNDELLVPINNYAANVPTFKQMTEMKSLTPAPPVRFRRTIESSIDSFTNPTGPLPLLSMKKTSLISTQQNMTENMQTSLYQHKTPEIITMDSDLQHKIEVERQRNKQRQRNQFFKSPVSATAESVFTIKDKVWSREQKKIDDILEPSLTTRKGRKRRRMRRKYKVHISPNAVDGHLMKKMLDLNSGEYKKAPESTQQTVFNSFQDNTHEMESSDTDISMREARQRIHSLLDDTFSAIKNYQKNLIKDEPLIKNTLPKPDFSQKLQSGLSSTPAALPIAPALGRTAIPVGSTSDSKFLQNAYANPYSPYINSTPFVEPLLSWDPVERQRFVNQRLGYPVYGQIPTSLTLPYGAPGQNVYVTPVHQRPDGVGNMVWTPHFETLVNPIQPFNVMDRNMLSGFPQSHSTVLDMNDYGDIKRKPGSQPLIRAIKDELQRLSNSAQGRTKVQEFQTRPTINESVT